MKHLQTFMTNQLFDEAYLIYLLQICQALRSLHYYLRDLWRFCGHFIGSIISFNQQIKYENRCIFGRSRKMIQDYLILLRLHDLNSCQTALLCICLDLKSLLLFSIILIVLLLLLLLGYYLIVADFCQFREQRERFFSRLMHLMIQAIL